MKLVFRFFVVFMFICFVLGCYAQQDDSFVPEGLYFGQELPGRKAELFAPDIITYEVHASPTISPDGKEMIIDSMGGRDKYYRMIDNIWTLQPELPFTLPGVCNDVFLSPSGKRAHLLIVGSVFYMSNKRGEKWGELCIFGK